MLSPLLTVLMGLPTALGPLVTANTEPGVCSAFLAQKEGQTVLYTAAHCLTSARTKLWLPGLEGDALRTGQSKWSTVHAIKPEEWQVHSTQDVAWKPWDSVAQAWPVGQLPAAGTTLTVLGYPEGKGPVTLACRYVGVALLDDQGTPRPRPALDCPPSAAFRKHTGFSGGVVLDEQKRAVGVLVSGSAMASGQVRPSFEPLLPWLVEGDNPFPVSLGWETPQPHQVELRVHQGKVVHYKVKSPDGVVWSQWPVLRVPTAAARLPE